MVEVVARVLETGGEDVAFSVNGDQLYLTRLGGVVRKHDRRDFWDRFPGLDEIVAGA